MFSRIGTLAKRRLFSSNACLLSGSQPFEQFPNTCFVAVLADANGSGTFPGVPPGRYFLMISARHNNQALVWGQEVQLKAGQNSLTLGESNATPIN
jgi:hypothetical protein